MNSLTTCLENLINGNLADAKRQAKRYRFERIVNRLFNCYGRSWNKAWKEALYLKGKGDWQEACDAK